MYNVISLLRHVLVTLCTANSNCDCTCNLSYIELIILCTFWCAVISDLHKETYLYIYDVLACKASKVGGRGTNNTKERKSFGDASESVTSHQKPFEWPAID